jgi:hypothetical protein
MNVSAFALGMVTTIAVIAIIVLIVGIVKVYKMSNTIKMHQHDANDHGQALWRSIDELRTDTHNVIASVSTEINMVDKTMRNGLKECNSYIDSRIDKLQAPKTKVKKELIKD